MEPKVDRRRGRPRDANGHFLPAETTTGGMEPPSDRQTWLARQRGGRSTTVEAPEDIAEPTLDGRRGGRSPLAQARSAAGRITIEHETDHRVKMWKPGPHGWIARPVPVRGIQDRLANGWLEYCPDCRGMELDGRILTGQECDIGRCPAKADRKFVVCPVIRPEGVPCGHRIVSTGFAYEAERVEVDDPNQVNPYVNLNVERELKGKMDQHILRFHADEARMLGIVDTDAMMAVARGA
jgi:hypothetical protein